MRQFFYLAWWFVRVRFFGKRNPLQTVLFITNQCNLACKHCSIYDSSAPVSKTKKQIGDELQYAYNAGARFVDFEGGEPTLWKENKHTLNDLILLAKQIGFFSATITTNAQSSFSNSLADSIWVSIDGVGAVHDTIRGKGAFACLETHLAQCGHRMVYANMVINNQNDTNVCRTIQYVKDSPYLQAISLNFHTPYAGTESLFLEWNRRATVLDEIIRMKKVGYPILNSLSGLKLMHHNNFKKQCWISNFILVDGTRLSKCPGSIAGICSCCGYGMAAEMQSLFRFRCDTLLAGLHLRIKLKNVH
jgi:MoaA/NifB/PqqE/SkfB family radical SAM enzyme